MTGLEAFIGSAVESIAIKVVESVFISGGGFAKVSFKFFKNRILRDVITASRKYAKNYENRHGTIKVLWMSSPIPLSSVYVNTNISSQSKEITSRKTYFPKKERKTSLSQESSNAIRIANRKQYLMVLGNPGCGKTTFLRKVGLEALQGSKGSFSHRCIPVFIELKRIDFENIDFVETISEEFKCCGFQDYTKFVEFALKDGRFLILFDGLDEVPSRYKNQVIYSIEDFVDQYKDNRFIASCRIAAYNSRFQRFTDVKISKFDDEQINEFVFNWFSSDLDREMNTAKRFQRLLANQENYSVKRLAKTPILLTFLCLVYDKTQSLPNNKTTIYSKALSILLEEWAAEKRLEVEAIYPGLYSGLETLLLAEIAYLGFTDDKLSFSEDYLSNHTRKFLIDRLGAEETVDALRVIELIEVQQGLLMKISDTLYSFSHTTFQEYLTAFYIHHTRNFKVLLDSYILEPRWHDVVLMISGMMLDRAESLIRGIYHKSLEYIHSDGTRSLLSASSILANTIQVDVNVVARRCLSIIYVLYKIRNSKIKYLVDESYHIYVTASKITEKFEKITQILSGFFNGGVVGLSTVRRQCLQVCLDVEELIDKVNLFIATAESEVEILEGLTKAQVASAYLLGQLKLNDIDLFNFQLAVMNEASGWIGQVIGEKIVLLKKLSSELNTYKAISDDSSRGSLTREKAAAYRSLYLKLKSFGFQLSKLSESFQVFYEKVENSQEETFFKTRINADFLSEAKAIVSICSDIQLTENDYSGLVQYLKLNSLIFRCKYASEGISTSKWRKFEQIILTSPVSPSTVGYRSSSL